MTSVSPTRHHHSLPTRSSSLPFFARALPRIAFTYYLSLVTSSNTTKSHQSVRANYLSFSFFQLSSLPHFAPTSPTNMRTVVDSASPMDSSSQYPSLHYICPTIDINPSLTNLIKPIAFPNSQSLDSLRSIFHQAIAQNLREVEAAYPPAEPLTPSSNNLAHLKPKPSRSFHEIHPSLLVNSPDMSSTTSPSLSSSGKGLFYLGTKTPYPPPNPAPPLPYPLNRPNTPRLIHVSLVARHGTRNPTNNCLQRLAELQQWLTVSLSPQPSWLRTWSELLDLYRQDPGSLTVEGEKELHGIGSRFAKLYARHLQLVGSTVRLRSSYKARAVSSARSFLEGYLDACTTFRLPPPVTLLDNESSSESSDSLSPDSDPSDSEPSETETDMSDIGPASTVSSLETSSVSSTEDDAPVEVLPVGDVVLRYFEHNVEYATFALQHKALTKRDLSKGPLRAHGKEMASRISKGLGASSAMDIDLVRAVSEACAFDFVHGRAATSMFCRVLTPKDTAILELFEKQHRPFFKGHERFRAIPAPLVADLAKSLRASVKTPNNPSAHAADLRFAHAETLVPLLLLLGIRTNGLSPHDPEFRQGLSAMSPFAANLAIELYEEDVENEKRHFVRFRLHERYVQCIPALGEHGATGIVELHHLLRFFDEILEEGMEQYQ